MPFRPENPLVVQSDKSVLLEVQNPQYEAARDALARFAELEKSPEHIHTYRITPLSLLSAGAILDSLDQFSKYDVPANVRTDVADYVSRFGRVKLVSRDGQLLLVSDDRALLAEIAWHKRITPFLLGPGADGALLVDPARRGHVKQALV